MISYHRKFLNQNSFQHLSRGRAGGLWLHKSFFFVRIPKLDEMEKEMNIFAVFCDYINILILRYFERETELGMKLF